MNISTERFNDWLTLTLNDKHPWSKRSFRKRIAARRRQFIKSLFGKVFAYGPAPYDSKKAHLDAADDLVDYAESFESYCGEVSDFTRTKSKRALWNERKSASNENVYDRIFCTLETEFKTDYPTIPTYRFRECLSNVDTFKLRDYRSFHSISNLHLHTDDLKEKVGETKIQRLERRKQFYASVKKKLDCRNVIEDPGQEPLISVHIRQDNAQPGLETVKSSGIVRTIANKSRKFGEATIRMIPVKKSRAHDVSSSVVFDDL